MKKLVFTFGRMNPPTIGHEKLANKIKSVAKQEKADARIYLSHTQNPTKDPLSYKQKLTFAKKAFGIAHQSNAKQIFQILKEIYADKYTDIVMVVGSDRVKEFSTLLNKYNGKGDYEFDSIKVVSAGERDPDAQGVEGMSGTKLRAIAKAGDFDTFKQAAASKLSDRDKKKMMDMVQKALSEEVLEDWSDEDTALYEELELLDINEAPLTPQQRRKRAMIMKRLAPKLARQRKIKAKQKAGGEKLQQRAKKQAIQIARERIAGEKGAKYKDLSPSAKQAIDKRVQKQSGIVNKLAKKLLPSVKKKEMERVKQARTQSEDFDALVESALKTIKVGEDAIGAKDTQYALVKERKVIAIGLKSEMQRLSMKEGGRVWKVSAENKVGDLVEAKTRQDPEIKDIEGTQPAKYYTGDMSKSTKEKRAAYFKKQAKKDDDSKAAYKPAPGDSSAETKPSKYTKKYKQMFGEDKKMPCPPATQDVKLNTKNRDATIKNFMYGPLNVDEPGDYWEKVADKWDTTVEAAKKSKCSNCVAFDISERMKDCMPGETSDADGELGYCWMHHFKCHSARTCTTWAKGGPITSDEKSYDWQERAGITEETQLDEKIKGLVTKSEKSGISYGILKKVYDRGMAAWKSGHRPGTTPQQWAFARVNSFITGGKTRTTADADLWAKHRGKSEAVSPAQQAAIAIAKKKSGKYDKDGKRINEAYEFGTDEYANHTKDMTPGQTDEMTVKDKKLKNLKIATGKSARQAKQTLARNKARADRKKGTGLAAAYNPDDDFGGKPVKKFKDFKKKNQISEGIQYHLDTGVPFADNIFRHDSPSFYMFFQEARVRWRNGELEPDATDKQILMTDIGLFGIYEGKEVPLDCPLMEADKDVELNSPKRGGSKKFYVYVKNDKGNVIKVEFGDTSGLKAKINDREAARSFAARHQCDTKNDKTKPGYWACRLPWYAKSLGLEGGGKYFW